MSLWQCSRLAVSLGSLRHVFIYYFEFVGGHYIAYVKDSSTECSDQWLRCNDAHVTRVSEESLQELYGGTAGKLSAYILTYQKIRKRKNGSIEAKRPPSNTLRWIESVEEDVEAMRVKEKVFLY